MLYEKKIQINNMISKVTDKEILKKIFTLVRDELINKFTYNNNGIFFDLNNITDSTLLQIESILIKCIENTVDTDTLKVNIYTTDDASQYLKLSNGFKLSNKEKNVINITSNRIKDSV